MTASDGRAHGIARNTAYNIAGSILPLAVTLVTVPLYLHQIGQARYGVLAIVWLILGYFSIFDMGLSRATSNHTAKMRDGTAEERQSLFWTALTMNALFGVLGGVLFWLLGGMLFENVIKMPSELRTEVMSALPWITLAVPILAVSGVLSGTLEGNSRFLTVNIISTIGSVVFALVPLAIAFNWSNSLAWLIPAAVLTRVAFAVPLFFSALRSLPQPGLVKPSMSLGRKLLGYGGWVMVTNIIGPILEAADRLLIAAILGVTAVTAYTIPFNLADRLRIIPQSLSRTLFPHLSTLNEELAQQEAKKSVRALGKVMALVVCLGILGIHLFVSLWINSDFAGKAAPVGEIILLGVWINGLAFLPFSLLQSQGRPDLTAKFHALELIPFLGILWLCMQWFGLQGAALAWTLRVTIDAGLLFRAARLTSSVLSDLWPALFALASSWTLAATLPDQSPWKWVVGTLLMLCLVIWVWQSEPKLREKLANGLPYLRRIPIGKIP
jgi:O-antigen/teichoic acid export membrane protein